MVRGGGANVIYFECYLFSISTTYIMIDAVYTVGSREWQSCSTRLLVWTEGGWG